MSRAMRSTAASGSCLPPSRRSASDKGRGSSPAPPGGSPGGLAPPAVTEIDAWQNLWGRADYKALGKKLFYTSKNVPYRTFTINGASEKGAEMGLTEAMTLSLKVTSAGVVTATLAFDTGRRQKGKTVYYSTTCQSVVVPASAADAETFEGYVPLYFAPSPANGFNGYSGDARYPF